MKNTLLISALAMTLISSMALAGSIHGTIKDAITLLPIAGAAATVHVVIPDSIALPTTSDVNGEYSITEIPPNNQIYGFVVYMSGYLPLWGRIDQLGSLDLTYDVLLEPDTGTGGGGDSTNVSGIVTASNDPKGVTTPVEGAVVKFVAGLNEKTSVTNSSGRYATRLPSGSYGVSVNASGYNTLSVGTVTVGPEGITVNAVLANSALDVPLLIEGVAEEYRLLNAFPNPFNPVTTIKYQLPVASHVSLKIYNMLGEIVSILSDETQSAGDKSVEWNAASFASGMYFYRLEATEVNNFSRSFSQVKKMLLLR